jgi:hypothetical protein
MQLLGLGNGGAAQSRCSSKSCRCCNKPSSLHFHNDLFLDLPNTSQPPEAQPIEWVETSHRVRKRFLNQRINALVQPKDRIS